MAWQIHELVERSEVRTPLLAFYLKRTKHFSQYLLVKCYSIYFLYIETSKLLMLLINCGHFYSAPSSPLPLRGGSTTIRLRTFRLQTFRLLLYTSVQDCYTSNFCFSKSLFSLIPTSTYTMIPFYKSHFH